MIPLPLIALLARWGIPAPLRKLAAVLAMLAGLIALCGLLWAIWGMIVRHHDAGVRKDDRASIDAVVIKASTAANDVANTNDAKRAADNARATILTERAIANAEASHPAEVRAPAGPISRAAADSLRTRAAKAGAAKP